MKTSTTLRINWLLAVLVVATMIPSAVSLARPSRSSNSHPSGPAHVKSYTRKDGMPVREHVSNAPKSGGSRANTSTGNKVPGPHYAKSPPKSGSSHAKVSPSKKAGASHFETGKNSHGATHAIGANSRKGPGHVASGAAVERDEHGRIKRSEAAKRQFMRKTGYPHGRPGYVVDHIKPLKRGGSDSPGNMQRQTKEDAKRKDKWE